MKPDASGLPLLTDVDTVIGLWLGFSAEVWDEARRRKARDHAWPRYMAQFTEGELERGAERLHDLGRGYTWSGWYRETRRAAAKRLGPATPPVHDVASAKGDGDGADGDKESISVEKILTGEVQASSDEIEKAAVTVIQGYLQEVQDVTELTPAMARAQEKLEDLAGSDFAVVGGHLQRVAELHVLLDSSTAPSLTSACGLLRRAPFYRSDLGVQAADGALALSPDSAATLTTRGAANIDLGKLEAARLDLDRAWELEGSSFTANAQARLRLKRDDTTAALRWATDAISLDPDSSAAQHMYVAACHAAGEEPAILIDDEDGAPAGPSTFVTVKAAVKLAEAGYDRLAADILDDVLEQNPGYAPAVQARAQLYR